MFLKCKPSSQGFNKLVIKYKNACKDINKTIFLEFWYLKMLNHVMYYFYLCKYYFSIFERLGHMQLKIKLCIFLKKKRFLLFLWKGIDLFNTEKASRVYIIISNIKYERVRKSREFKINCKMIFQILKFIKNWIKTVFGKT